jgi:DNA-binding response OmpR family regulator
VEASSVRILVVANDKGLAVSLRKSLKREGFAVDTAQDSEQASRRVFAVDYDVIILEAQLPGNEDGLAFLRRFRRNQISTEVLLLGEPGGVWEKVRGLDAGADDYLVKPFSMRELLARVRMLVRRAHVVKTPVLRVHDLEIDTTSRQVTRAGRLIDLTPQEYALLQFLAYHQGRLVTRSMIEEHLSDENTNRGAYFADHAIRYLRKKIDLGFSFPLIVTRRGAGYILGGEPN